MDYGSFVNPHIYFYRLFHIALHDFGGLMYPRIVLQSEQIRKEPILLERKWPDCRRINPWVGSAFLLVKSQLLRNIEAGTSIINKKGGSCKGMPLLRFLDEILLVWEMPHTVFA
jgi:hypothetical protein